LANKKEVSSDSFAAKDDRFYGTQKRIKSRPVHRCGWWL